uniref:Uncharacterized protein n=1 Tax=Ditylenchus dipsaci TaxID=166011 RepID=A0A915E1N0_9BILA
MQSQIERQKKRGIQRTQRKLKKEFELSSLNLPTAQQIQSQKAYRAKKLGFSNTLSIENLRQNYEKHKQIPEDLDQTFVVVTRPSNHHKRGRRTQGPQLTKNFMQKWDEHGRIMRALHKFHQSWLVTWLAEDYHGGSIGLPLQLVSACPHFLRIMA